MADREYHKDGSYTDRHNGSSVTYGPNGDTRESVTPESGVPLLGPFLAPDILVTRDGEGNITKTEWYEK